MSTCWLLACRVFGLPHDHSRTKPGEHSTAGRRAAGIFNLTRWSDLQGRSVLEPVADPCMVSRRVPHRLGEQTFPGRASRVRDFHFNFFVEGPEWVRHTTLSATTAWVRRWRNRGLQRGLRECPLSGGGRADFNGRHAAQSCPPLRGGRKSATRADSERAASELGSSITGSLGQPERRHEVTRGRQGSCD